MGKASWRIEPLINNINAWVPFCKLLVNFWIDMGNNDICVGDLINDENCILFFVYQRKKVISFLQDKNKMWYECQ